MHEIDTAGSVDGKFSIGNPELAIKATRLGQDWPNAVQAELKNVILASGQTLDKENNSQLLAAIRAIVAASTGPVLPQDIWWESTNYGADVELGSTAGRKVWAMKLANGSTQGFGADFILPNAAKDYRLGFIYSQSTAESGHAVVMKAEIQIIADGENPAANNADVSSTQTISTRADTGKAKVENANFTITAANRHGDNDLARVRLERIGGDGSDTHTGDTYIHGLYMVEV